MMGEQTHPSFEPDKCPVYLSSETLQDAGECGQCPGITWPSEKGNYSRKG